MVGEAHDAHLLINDADLLVPANGFSRELPLRESLTSIVTLCSDL